MRKCSSCCNTTNFAQTTWFETIIMSTSFCSSAALTGAQCHARHCDGSCMGALITLNRLLTRLQACSIAESLCRHLASVSFSLWLVVFRMIRSPSALNHQLPQLHPTSRVPLATTLIRSYSIWHICNHSADPFDCKFRDVGQ